MENRKEFQIKGNTWGAILVLVIAFIAVFFIAKSIFWLLSLVAPVLLIAAVIIDYKVLTNYINWLVSLAKRNLLVGLGAIALSIIGYPVVFALLLGRALMNRKLKQIEKQQQVHRDGELVDFEELESQAPPPLELPKEEPEAGYEDMFKG
ncbi:MAG: hypothetical protein IPL49_12695 [Saprospirales bacterium]|nr:hypothetical protein [Saprospirales bacterium]MBK8491709.1 hypothetical protein [Saprospirales bacterium]